MFVPASYSHVELLTEVLMQAVSISINVVLKGVLFSCWYLRLLSYHYFNDYYCCHCCD